MRQAPHHVVVKALLLTVLYALLLTLVRLNTPFLALLGRHERLQPLSALRIAQVERSTQAERNQARHHVLLVQLLPALSCFLCGANAARERARQPTPCPRNECIRPAAVACADATANDRALRRTGLLPTSTLGWKSLGLAGGGRLRPDVAVAGSSAGLRTMGKSPDLGL